MVMEVIHDEDGSDRQRKALTPWPPLSQSERGGKKTIRAVFLLIYRREGCEIIESECNTNK